MTKLTALTSVAPAQQSPDNRQNLGEAARTAHGATSNAVDAPTVLTEYADGHAVKSATAASAEPKRISLEIAAQELNKDGVREALLEGYQLPEKYINWYYTRRVAPKQERPDFEKVENPDVLYRGKFVTLDQLSHIIDAGFEVDLTRWNTGGDKGVSFSSSATEAVDYIFTSRRDKVGIGVVFVVRADDNILPLEHSNLNSTDTIYRAPQDVPASQILDVLVWGRWGCEGLSKIFEKIREGTITPHEQWTTVASPFMR